jgi:hypothetical protein
MKAMTALLSVQLLRVHDTRPGAPKVMRKKGLASARLLRENVLEESFF